MFGDFIFKPQAAACSHPPSCYDPTSHDLAAAACRHHATATIISRDLAAIRQPPAMVLCLAPRATLGAPGCRREGPLCEALQTENARFEHFGF
jgi:hypothetical protein